MKKTVQQLILTIFTLFASTFPASGALISREMTVFSPQHQCTRHVSSEGSSVNPGTLEQPWRSIQYAADRAQPGDVICVKAGTYYERVVIKNSGEVERPIIFQGERGPDGEYLTIVNGGALVGSGWQPFSGGGSGAYRIATNQIPEGEPAVMVAYGKHLGRITKSSDHSIDGDGFSVFGPDGLNVTIDAEFVGRIVNLWEPTYSAWGNKSDGYTYIRFKDGANPNTIALSAAPPGSAGFLISGKQYNTIRDFSVHTAEFGIKLDNGAHHNIIEQNFLSSATVTFYSRGGAHHNIIRYNEMTGNFYGIEPGSYRTRNPEEDAKREALYRFGKRWSSNGGSDNKLMRIEDAGSDSEIAYNHLHDAQFGIWLWGAERLDFHHNILHGTVGSGLLVWHDLVDVQIHDNLIYNCNVQMRFHHADEQSSSYRVYIYRNRFYQLGKSSNNYTHYVNRTLGVKAQGNYYVYHNSFSGGRGLYFGGPNGLSGGVYLNNIFSQGPESSIHGARENFDYADQMRLFDYNWMGGKFNQGYPPVWFGSNNTVETGGQIWDSGSLPDFHLPVDSTARNAGIDLSKTFTIDGVVYNPLPGMETGYFSGSKPDMGAIQFDERTPTFIDVPTDHWAHDYIEALYQGGYISGCNNDPLMYCPEAIMTRAESAVFVERGIHGAGYLPGQPASLVFDDVPLWEWFAKWADGLWLDGYTAGCGTDPLVYCPLQEHTRTEGTVFFLRMLYGADYVPPDPLGLFIDVLPEFWGAKWIEAAYNAGLITACETSPELRFCPGDPLTRAMGAYMMVQAKGLNLP